MYIFEILLLIFALSGLFMSQIFGGCLGFAIFLFIFFSFLVFIGTHLVWFFVAGLIIYGYGCVYKYFKWKKLPDLKEYLIRNPNSKLEMGVACNNCNSDKIIHQGLFYKRDKLRFYSCPQCGTTLFRFKSLEGN